MMSTAIFSIYIYIQPGAHEPPKAAKERASAHSSTATSYVT